MLAGACRLANERVLGLGTEQALQESQRPRRRVGRHPVHAVLDPYPAVDPDPVVLAGYLRDLGMEVEEPLAPSVEEAVRASVRNRWVPVRRGGRPVGQPLTGAEGSGS